MTRFAVTPHAHPVADDVRRAAVASPVLGRDYGDHMAVATWTPELGWHDRRVGALAPFTMHPAGGVLHYAQEIFEGMKAYRQPDGGVALFRPEKNAARFVLSTARRWMWS